MTYQMKLDETWEEATREKALQTARSALECGIPVETVAKFTGLSLDEVKELL